MDITMGSRSEKTGRFNFVRGADGDVSFDETRAHEVVTSVTETHGSWIHDETHGSKLRSLRKLSTATPSQADAMTLESLQTLEEDNEVVEPEANSVAEVVRGQRTGRLSIRVRWKTPSGEQREEEVVA